MFLISKCRGDQDLDLCTFGVLAKGEPLCNDKFRFFLRAKHVYFPARAPRQDHVYNTTSESFRFHNKNFDDMRCKLDSTENPCALRNTQPYQWWEAGGGQFRGAGRNVTFLFQVVPQFNLCKYVAWKQIRRLIRAIWFAETLRRTFFVFSPPGLTCSSRPHRNFAPKNLCQHFFHQITTPPRYSQWMGFLRNERAYSVESSLQGISSESLLWKQIKL